MVDPLLRVYTVRHGETIHNVEKRIQGPLLDDPLNARGRSQAAALERRFAEAFAKGERVAAVYSSPMKRAFETAEAVARGVQAPLVRAPGLIEFSWGSLLGRTEDGEVLEKMKRYHDRWRAGEVTLPVEGGGESPAGAFARAWRELGPIVARHADASAAARASGRSETIAWVAHGRILKVILASLAWGDVARMDEIGQGNTAVSLIEHAGVPPFDRGWRVIFLNDRSHASGDDAGGGTALV